MGVYLIPIALLLPIVGGAFIPFLPFKKRGYMEVYIEAIVVTTSIIAAYLLLCQMGNTCELIHFSGNLSISFRIDGLGSVFMAMISFLWPLATLYAFEYMKHDPKKEKSFFMFYTWTYAVTLGIAMSANMLTMYCFYEMLTLVTVPLVLHTGTREAILASRKYLYYSLGGAAFAFIGMIFVIAYGITPNFTYGGVLDLVAIGNRENILKFIYVITFMGFGVKAALFPFNSWLPQASVAPTPVTALLHAVAVVKSGAFATMRLTYYCYGTEFLKGSWAQYVVMGFVIFTIIYGCSMAVKETHFKRRLAFSTVSNLSYILFGVVIMTPLGLIGALCHMLFHAFMKICSFLCAGAVIVQSGKTYVHELDGMGKKMPQVFGLFTVSALALMGVPGLCGFISKWYLAKAAAASGNVMAYCGIGALLISALLTGIYMLSVVIRAFFPKKGFDDSAIQGVKDPGWHMMIPLYIFAAGCVVFGIYSGPIVEYFTNIANGLI